MGEFPLSCSPLLLPIFPSTCRGALGAGGFCFLRGDPRSSGKFPLLPSLRWGPETGVCWTHYIPAPKPLALLQAVSGGFGESEKAPFLPWALKRFAGNLGGGGDGETALGLILPNAEYHSSSYETEHQQGSKALPECRKRTEPKEPDPPTQ